MLKVLNVLQESFNARPAINMGTLLACVIRRSLSSQETHGTSIESGIGICASRFHMQPVK